VRSAIDIATVQWPGPIATSFDPESVQVSGPRHMVVRVSSVRTVKTTIPFPDSLPHLVDIDTTGLGAMCVRPSQVKVMLTLLPHS
jgi:hypothetical protein